VPEDKIVVIAPDSSTWIKEVLKLYNSVAEANKNAE
jgi:hypothetical protein